MVKHFRFFDDSPLYYEFGWVGDGCSFSGVFNFLEFRKKTLPGSSDLKGKILCDAPRRGELAALETDCLSILVVREGDYDWPWTMATSADGVVVSLWS